MQRRRTRLFRLTLLNFARAPSRPVFPSTFVRNALTLVTELSITDSVAHPLLLRASVATRDRKPDGTIASLGPTRCSIKDKEFEMLVLSRKVGERIHVGDNIVLEIRRIAGNRVTLALEAPRTVRILRGELEQAAREFEPAANTAELHVDLTPEVIAPESVSIFHSLPVDAVGHECVS